MDKKFQYININDNKYDDDSSNSSEKQYKDFKINNFVKFKPKSNKDDLKEKEKKLKGAESKVKSLLSTFLKNIELEKKNNEVNENKFNNKNLDSNVNIRNIRKRNTIITHINLKENSLLNFGNENRSNQLNNNQNKYSSNIDLPDNSEEITKKKSRKKNNNSLIFDKSIKVNKTTKTSKFKKSKKPIEAKNNKSIKNNNQSKELKIEISSNNFSNKFDGNTQISLININNEKSNNDLENILNNNKKAKDELFNKIFKDQNKKGRNEIYNESFHSSLMSDGSEANIIQKSFDTKSKNNQNVSKIISNNNIVSSISLKNEFLSLIGEKKPIKLSQISNQDISKKTTQNLKSKNILKKKYGSINQDFKHTKSLNVGPKNKLTNNKSIKNESSSTFKSIRDELRDTIILRPEDLDLSFAKTNSNIKKLTKSISNGTNNIKNIKHKRINKTEFYPNRKKMNKSLNCTNIGKLDEKEIYKRIYSYVDQNNQLSISQSIDKNDTKEENNKEKTTQNESQTKINKTKTPKSFYKNPIKRSSSVYIERYRHLYQKKNIYDSLDDDEIDEGDDSRIYLDPNSKFVLIFDGLLFISTMICFVETPFYLSMTHDFCRKDKISFVFIINVFTEFLNILDFFLGFFRAYYNWEEQLVCKKRKIIKKYLTDWFLFDLIAAIPIYTINKLNEPYCNNYELSTLHYNYVLDNLNYMLISNKLLKVYKVHSDNQARKALANKLNDNWNFLLTILIVISALNYFACLYILIARNSYPNWLLNAKLGTSPYLDIYVCSIYILMTSLTTVGYGDLTCYNFHERIYQLFLLIVGSVAYSYIVSAVSNFIIKIDEKSAEFRKKKSILDEIRLNYPKLPEELYERILKHLIYKNANEKKQKNMIFDCLPLSLKNDLVYEMYKPVIENFIFFKNFQNTDFIVRVILAFRAVVAYKNDILVNEGDMIKDIMFVKKGVLSIELPINITNPQDNVDKYLNMSLLKIEKGPNVEKLGNSSIFSNKNEQKNVLIINNENQKNTLEGTNIDATKISTTYFGQKTIKNETGKIKVKEEIKYVKLLGIRKNEHFGDVLMFLEQRCPLRLRVRSKKCELFFLRKMDAIKISTSYQNIWRKINKKSIYNFEQIKKSIHKIIEIYSSTKFYDTRINNLGSEIKSSGYKKSLKGSINKRKRKFDSTNSALYKINVINIPRSFSLSCPKKDNCENIFKKIDNNFEKYNNDYEKKNLSLRRIPIKLELESPYSQREKLQLSYSYSSSDSNEGKKIKDKKTRKSKKDIFKGRNNKVKSKTIMPNKKPEKEDSSKDVKCSDISKKILDPKKFKKFVNSISIKNAKKKKTLFNKHKHYKSKYKKNSLKRNVSSTKTIKADDSYSIKFMNDDDIGLIEVKDENNESESNISFYERVVNDEIYPGEEIKINKENILLFNKKLNLPYQNNKKLVNDSSIDHKNSKINLLLHSFEKGNDLIDEESIKKYKSKISSYNGNNDKISKSNISSKNNKFESSKSSKSLLSPIKIQFDKKDKKRIAFEQNSLTVNSEFSFSFESSYDNCNLLTGEKLIKSKLLKEKLKNFLLNEINISSAVNNSNIKKIISVADTNNNDSTNTRFHSPISKKNSSLNLNFSAGFNKLGKKKVKKVSSLMFKKHETMNLKNKTLQRTLSVTENLVPNNSKPFEDITKNNENVNINVPKRKGNILKRQMSAKDLFYLNTNFISSSKDLHKKITTKKSFKNFSPFFKNKKKKENLLLKIDLNIENTNQKLNNPEEFYSKYFNNILENQRKEINNDSKEINYSGFFGQSPKHEEAKIKKERLLKRSISPRKDHN